MNDDRLKEWHVDLYDVAKKLRNAETKLEISWTLIEDRRKIVISRENVYLDVELDSWKLDFIIIEVQKEIFGLEREQKLIVCQVAKMQKGDGMSI